MAKAKEEIKSKKPMTAKAIVLILVFLAIVGLAVWLLMRNSGSNNSGTVKGVKEETNQTQDTVKTVPESKYFSANAKIMYFYSDTCHWCEQEKTVLGELGAEGYRFKPMNVGTDTSLWEKYQITGTPTFVSAGNERLIGFREKAELQDWLDKNGGKPTK